MYPRTKTVDGRTYLQIVESYREGKKTRQRVIATLGRLDKLQEKGEVDNLVVKLARFTDRVSVMSEYEKGNLSAGSVVSIGPDLIMGRLWQELGISRAIESLLSESKHSFPLERAIYLATLARLFFPGSDRRAKRISRDYRVRGAEEIELHHLYRAMAWLGEARSGIEERIFDSSRDLFTSLSLVFFDTTSIYFEGAGGEEMGRRGYSKDRRPDENQMVVGVVADQDGRPISCPMWPGNMTDSATIVPVASSLRERFGVGEVVIVADRGMIGKKNIASLKELGFSHILGVKMRLEKKAMADVLSRGGRFSSVDDILRVKEVKSGGKRYIVCLNPDEQKKDRLTREAMVSELKEKLKRGASQLVGNTGYRRFLKVAKSGVTLDEEKVKQDERFDGLFVLTTDTDLPAAEVAKRYKELWMVERVFREAKNTLSTRPVFHQRDASIMGHVFISFLALLMMHELKKRTDNGFEWDEMRQDLAALYEVEVKNNGKSYFLRSKLQGVCGQVFQAVGVAIPPSANDSM